MSNQVNFEESITRTLKTIDELYDTNLEIKRVYHFQYKTEETANNFGKLLESIADESSHHTIYDVVSYKISDNMKNLIIKTTNPKVGEHVIAYTLIPPNYRFDIVTTPLDGRTLVIYDKNICKPDEKVKKITNSENTESIEFNHINLVISN